MNYLNRYGTLTVLNIKVVSKTRYRRVVAVCECGSVRTYQFNNLRSGRTSSCGCLSGRRGGSRQEHPSYEATHKRLKYHRGAAREYTCECGEPARDWSWQGCTTEPLYGPMRGRTTLMGYCLHQEDYVPMCKRCHEDWDMEMRRTNNSPHLRTLTDA